MVPAFRSADRFQYAHACRIPKAIGAAKDPAWGLVYVVGRVWLSALRLGYWSGAMELRMLPCIRQ